MSADARPARPPRPQTVLTVESTERLSPHLVRVIASGEALDEFAENGKTDKYVKIMFAPAGSGLVPPYDVPAIRESLPPEHWPVVRTYTVRRVDVAARRLAIDFVVHGDEGVAGPWALRAQPGDVLVFVGPGGAYSPDPAAERHLLAGDTSALPAIASALEELARTAPDTRGIALLQVPEAADVVELEAPSGVELRWLIDADTVTDAGPDAPADLVPVLARAIDALDWPLGDVQVFAHGERESMKAVREVLRRREVPRARLSLSGYWAQGRTEDSFQAEKREPIGRIPD